MRIALLLPLVAACGSDGPTHWNKQPLQAFDGTIDGQAFTIQLPKGMEKSKVESKYDVEYGYHVDGRVYSPSVSVSHRAKKETLDDAIKSESSVKAPTDVLFKEESATGWVYAIENDSYKGREDYLIRAETFVGDGALYCSARIYPMRKGGKAKDDIPTAAKLCQSLKAK